MSESELDRFLTVADLRNKRKDGTPVMWTKGDNAYGGMYGIVRRVAKDGSWADITWWQGPPRLNDPPSGYPSWSKRQPLGSLELTHG